MTAASAGQPVVLCVECARKLRNPKARAKRIGPVCERNRRADRQPVVQALPGIPGQDGPDLLDASGESG